MRLENLWCEECGFVHFVQVIQRDNRGRVVKTKCYGKDFLPTDTHLSALPGNETGYYVKHRLRGYDVIKKMKNKPRTKLPATFHRQHPPKPIPQPIPVAERTCLAEISLSIRGQFVTIKVFEDATPEKFYEFYYQVGGKPMMTKTRNIGREKPVHISEIGRIFNADGEGKLVFHNRDEYEKLLVIDPMADATILEKNMRVVAAMSNNQ